MVLLSCKTEGIKMNYKTFKQLVSQISEIKNEEEVWKASAEVDKSFQNGKINWDDEEMLMSLINIALKAYRA